MEASIKDIHTYFQGQWSGISKVTGSKSLSALRLFPYKPRKSIEDGEVVSRPLLLTGCLQRCSGCRSNLLSQPPSQYRFWVSFDELIDQIQRDLKGKDIKEDEEYINRMIAEGKYLQTSFEQYRITGVTLLGGEPFLQAEKLVKFLDKIADLGLEVWTYTGYMFENLVNNPIHYELLKRSHYLVDGPYNEKERTAPIDEIVAPVTDMKKHHMYKGSKNQRMINVQETLRSNIIVFWKPRFAWSLPFSAYQ
jgi:organic radical activating enzyme